MNRIQFQSGMSLSQFLELYGTEEQCEAALEQSRWANGFRCPRCGEQEHGLVYGRRHRRYQCRSCRHQTTVTAGTIMEATKPLGFCVGAAFSERISSCRLPSGSRLSIWWGMLKQVFPHSP
jgi:predicted RNA-binding Zn-ribbon protein involved in translation (DUF1610 family)